MKQLCKTLGLSASLLLSVLPVAFAYPAGAFLEINLSSMLEQTVFGSVRIENGGTEDIETWLLEIEVVDAELEDTWPEAKLQSTRIEGGLAIHTYQLKPDPFFSDIAPGQTQNISLAVKLNSPTEPAEDFVRVTKFDYLLRRPTESAVYRVDDAIVTVMKVGDWVHGAVLQFELRGATDSPIPDWEMDFDLSQEIVQYWNSELRSNGIHRTLYHAGIYEPFDTVPPAGDKFLYFGVETATGGLDLLPLVTRVGSAAPTAKSAAIKQISAPRKFRLVGPKANIPVRFSNVVDISVESTGQNRVRPRLLRRSQISTIVVRRIRAGNARVTITATDRSGQETQHHIAIQRRRSIDTQGVR